MNRLGSVLLATIAVFAVVLPASTAGATPTPAGADGLSVNVGSGWTHAPTNPLFTFTRIAPGWTGTSTLAVRNDTNEPATIGVTATDVVEAENGCNRPESFVDTTCAGADSGELGKELILTIYADSDNDGTFDPSPTWTGTIEALQQQVRLASSLHPGESSSYKIDAQLPASAGNETETDEVGFNLKLNLDGVTVSVEGTKITRQSGPGPLRGVLAQLPLTGSPAERVAAAALSLVIAGAALVLAGKRRRRKGTF